MRRIFARERRKLTIEILVAEIERQGLRILDDELLHRFDILRRSLPSRVKLRSRCLRQDIEIKFTVDIAAGENKPDLFARHRVFLLQQGREGSRPRTFDEMCVSV